MITPQTIAPGQFPPRIISPGQLPPRIIALRQFPPALTHAILGLFKILVELPSHKINNVN